MKFPIKSLIFAAALVFAGVGGFQSQAKASELVNHTYHWYRLIGSGDHHRITSHGLSTTISVSFSCGWACANYWTIHSGHHASRPGKAGHFSATPHWTIHNVWDFVQKLLDPQEAGLALAAVFSTTCTGSVGKHKEEGIASQFVVQASRTPVTLKLYC